MNEAKSQEYILIGLTGSIGSGKSAVAEVFRACGIPVIGADEVAKELMTGDATMKARLCETFGEAAFLPGGELNRAYLAERIFSDPALRERMNDIVHPMTIAEQGVRARALVAEGYRAVACEAALILETGGEGRFDYLVVVDADRDLRLRRAAERDGVDVATIAARDAAQMPAERKVEAADFVIKNNGTPQELERNARFIATLLKSLPPRERIETSDDDAEETGDEDEPTGE